jgi:hypothetical protein
MLRIIPKRSRERDSHTARVQKIPMRPFTSPIHKPMLFQIRDELPNLARHIKLPSKKQLQSNAKFPKFAAAIVRSRASADEETPIARISRIQFRHWSFPLRHSPTIREIRGFPGRTHRSQTGYH